MKEGFLVQEKTVKIIIAGGGTGGHLFPGIAVAEELLKRNRQNNVLFIGTERGIEKKILGTLGFQLCLLDVEGIKGRGLRIFTALLKIPRSVIQSYRIIRQFSPDFVIGVGGYASGPAVMTAHFMGIRTAIMEQNAVPGLTNKILGKCAERIFITFPDTKKWFAEKKTIISGNPVRLAFLENRKHPIKKEDKFTILIFGGSQGAHAINMAVTDALPHLHEIQNELKIIHQTGEKDLIEVSQQYKNYAMDAHVVPFIMNMAEQYNASDLLICRAGATSIAEITACGKAAILIPFPFAVNDHQTKNAEVLAHSKAAMLIHEKNLSGQVLAEIIEQLYWNPHVIKEMAENSSRLGNRKAASDIVDALIK